MDKYEFSMRIDELKRLAANGQFRKAGKVLETIEIKKIKNIKEMYVVVDILVENERYDQARELLVGISKKMKSRRVIHQLIDVCIKSGQIEYARKYMREFQKMAPNDPYNYVFQYQIAQFLEESYDKQIGILESLKQYEYMEKWAYELAKVYHRAGREADCVAECEDLILWFGEGIYVEKARLLKQYLMDAVMPSQLVEGQDLQKSNVIRSIFTPIAKREEIPESQQQEDIEGELEDTQAKEVRINREVRIKKAFKIKQEDKTKREDASSRNDTYVADESKDEEETSLQEYVGPTIEDKEDHVEEFRSSSHRESQRPRYQSAFDFIEDMELREQEEELNRIIEAANRKKEQQAIQEHRSDELQENGSSEFQENVGSELQEDEENGISESQASGNSDIQEGGSSEPQEDGDSELQESGSIEPQASGNSDIQEDRNNVVEEVHEQVEEEAQEAVQEDRIDEEFPEEDKKDGLEEEEVDEEFVEEKMSNEDRISKERVENEKIDDEYAIADDLEVKQLVEETADLIAEQIESLFFQTDDTAGVEEELSYDAINSEEGLVEEQKLDKSSDWKVELREIEAGYDTKELQEDEVLNELEYQADNEDQMQIGNVSEHEVEYKDQMELENQIENQTDSKDRNELEDQTVCEEIEETNSKLREEHAHQSNSGNQQEAADQQETIHQKETTYVQETIDKDSKSESIQAKEAVLEDVDKLIKKRRQLATTKKLNEFIQSRIGGDVEAKEYLGQFAKIHSIGEEILRSLESISDAHNNITIIICGQNTFDETYFARRLAKLFYSLKLIKTQKLVILNEEKFLAIDFNRYIDEIKGGCIVVEEVKESSEQLRSQIQMLHENECLVMLEAISELTGGEEEIREIENNACLENVHTNRQASMKDELQLTGITETIWLEAFDADELMGFAEEFLEEKEYIIEEDAKKYFKNYVEELLESQASDIFCKVLEKISKAYHCANQRNRVELRNIAESGNYLDAAFMSIKYTDFANEN